MNRAAIISVLAITIFGCGIGKILSDNPKRTYLDQSKCDCDSIRSEYYSEGNVWSETPYKNGVVHGTKKLYYMNGGVLRVVDYQNDVEDGTLTDYTPEGAVRISVIIRNGKILGVK